VLLAEVAKQRENFPVLHRAVKPKGEVSLAEQMIAELPIGEARGRWRRNKRDQLHMDLRLFWVGRLEAIRTGDHHALEAAMDDIVQFPALGEVVEAARRLPQKKGHEGEWARVIVRWMEAQGWTVGEARTTDR
jgi:hypothetical protein